MSDSADRRRSVKGRRVMDAVGGLPVVADDPQPQPQPPPRTRRPAPGVEAHLLGQEQRRRGLRGGPETLDAARESYLRTEFSGEADRRPPTGLLTRKSV